MFSTPYKNKSVSICQNMKTSITKATSNSFTLSKETKENIDKMLTELGNGLTFIFFPQFQNQSIHHDSKIPSVT